MDLVMKSLIPTLSAASQPDRSFFTNLSVSLDLTVLYFVLKVDSQQLRSLTGRISRYQF